MLKKLLVALAFVLPLDGHAGLWEWTYSGTAFLPTGEKGIQTVSYVWDPLDIVVTHGEFHCQVPVLWCGIFLTWAEGPLKAATWKGLVNGSGPGVAISWDDSGPDKFSRIGRSTSFHVGPDFNLLVDPEFWLFGANPVLGVTTTWRRHGGEFDIFGGEEGWSWQPPTFTLALPREDQELTLSLRALPAPGTIPLLLVAWLVFAKLVRRVRLGRRYKPVESKEEMTLFSKME